jgi:dCMP deaminase
MNNRLVTAHMAAAEIYAQLSYATRRKVGCVIVKGDTIIAIGYNGTPPGWNNACEGEDGKTVAEVLHAEQNALDKIVRSTVSSEDSTVFVTTAPCIECAKRLMGARVLKVYYRDVYRNEDGLKFLEQSGIQTEKVTT